MSKHRPYTHDVLIAEMLRRKGLAIADAQRMRDQPEPWYRQLSWNAAEEERYKRWWFRCIGTRFHEPSGRLELTWFFFAFDAGLHRRDQCTDPGHHHAESRDADLPRRRWLTLERALEKLSDSEDAVAAPESSSKTSTATQSADGKREDPR